MLSEYKLLFDVNFFIMPNNKILRFLSITLIIEVIYYLLSIINLQYSFFESFILFQLMFSLCIIFCTLGLIMALRIYYLYDYGRFIKQDMFKGFWISFFIFLTPFVYLFIFISTANLHC